MTIANIGNGDEITSAYAAFQGTKNTWEDPETGSIISPSSANYVGPEFYGFYGAELNDAEFTGSITGAAISTSPDYLTVSTNMTGETGTGAMLFVPILEVTNVSAINFFEFAVRGSGSGANTQTFLRFVVQLDDSSYVISNEISSPSGSVTQYDIGTLSWNEYAPATDAWAIGASSSFDGTGNITAVGFYLTEVSDLTAGGANPATGTTAFTVDGDVIPEPSHYALLAGLVTLGLLARRRRG
ncbi:PEP-CTERM sorting domain-containing protein [Cerasicoccus maritimus]|uniref:PEP-CTERM sorting domain-containing protein n=1 Tax=Cerasicoccus maritimus TaxID=490089 RepID=UPI002852555F|nr:PEP-CTERM sorting domain-containing protein [Cerasicoccus maritimus]